MSMLDTLLPRHSYRRFLAVLLSHGLRGRAGLRDRFVGENFELYRLYRGRTLRCNVCAEQGTPFFDFPDLALRREHGIGVLRETLQCRHCGATLRHRTLAAVLLDAVARKSGRKFDSIAAVDTAALAGLRILDTDAFSPISKRLRANAGYIVTSFMPDKPFDTEIAPGHLNLNLERMGIASESFDVVLTSDVMEHVRDIDAAHREIARILKPGGQYLFTVPYDATVATHTVLVDTQGEQDVFLVPPHYHGDPLSGGILAYRIFGRQLFADLERCGLHARFVELDDPAALIIQGDAFIATKAGATDLPSHATTRSA
jgi:SAM-dependent methyltransferase